MPTGDHFEDFRSRWHRQLLLWVGSTTIVLLAVIALMVVVWIRLQHAYGDLRAHNVRQRSFEVQTCRIQRRGLPASHALSASMQDLEKLLFVRPRRGQPPPPPKVEALVVDLRKHLAIYVSATSKQPTTRTC